MPDKAVQDCYADEFAHCYGCGRLNQDGMQIKSYWDGQECLCRYKPRPYYTGGFPGFSYGGLISSLMDCHSAATASAAKLQAEGFTHNARPPSRFVTASLKVDFLKPTPIDKVLELKARSTDISDRKVIVSVTLSADGEICAKGEAVMVKLPDGVRK
jgi:acyl-coenzyme A thioesterase PaaI-like protein